MVVTFLLREVVSFLVSLFDVDASMSVFDVVAAISLRFAVAACLSSVELSVEFELLNVVSIVFPALDEFDDPSDDEISMTVAGSLHCENFGGLSPWLDNSSDVSMRVDSTTASGLGIGSISSNSRCAGVSFGSLSSSSPFA